MIEWSDEAIATALRVWLRLSEVGEFRDVRWRETMRQALEAAVEAQNRPDVMGDALAKALIRATDLEIEAYRLKTEIKTADEMMLNQAKTIKRLQQENEKLRAALKPFAANVDQPTRIYEHEGVRMVLVDQDVLLRLCRTAAAALENNNV